MAIDGIKIIDSDLAHDVYSFFMDSYDAGGSPDEAAASVEELRYDNDAIDEEIFITTLGLALWKVGGLTPEILQEIRQAIERRAFVSYLVEIEKAIATAKQRAQILEKFWDKISQPNSRPRKRKAYKNQKQFPFHEGDVLTHQLHDGSYYVVILMLISQYRNICSYNFIVHTYNGFSKPTIPDIISGTLLGRLYEPPNFPVRRIGFHSIGIEHKMLKKFASSLEVIGNLVIQESSKCCGNQHGAVDLKSFISCFESIAYHFLGDRRNSINSPQQIFPVQTLTAA